MRKCEDCYSPQELIDQLLKFSENRHDRGQTIKESFSQRKNDDEKNDDEVVYDK